MISFHTTLLFIPGSYLWQVNIITSKAEASPLVVRALTTYHYSGRDAFIRAVHDTILKRKIRYPILEYMAQEFYDSITEIDLINIADGIIALQQNGSEVIAGKMLQLRLDEHYEECINKAAEYIMLGSNWLPCDTMGERVFGHALFTDPKKTIPVLKRLAKHENKWIVRSVGVAVHYAVKKGLMKAGAEEMFRLLLSLADTTDFHTKKGIGWAAKTTAKFHPDIIMKYTVQLEQPEIKQWFKTKIKIGSGRAYKYAHRYTS
ncbi:MAG: alkylation repair protein [Flavipsychrobacter sp.]|jgi:3-methyladenine DNA glycosylase AlkD|nr:alkylation repair protein [Flavipsychrobacter sp.]